MLTRTKSAKVVNGMLRAAFGDEAMDVTASLKIRSNYAFVSDDAVVVFTRHKSNRGTYSAIMGVLPAAQRNGIGTSTLNEAIGWMFANTRANTVQAVIDRKISAIDKITSRIRIHANDREVTKGRLIVSCTRASWLAMFPGAPDV